MSKIPGSVGLLGERGSNSAIALAKLRDHYANRERENENRHRDELEALREAHRVEIEQVRADAERRVVAVQEQSVDKLNQKDLHFQKEIDALRSIYQKRSTEVQKNPALRDSEIPNQRQNERMKSERIKE